MIHTEVHCNGTDTAALRYCMWFCGKQKGEMTTDDRYQERRKHTENFFIAANAIDYPILVSTSSSGQFTLEVQKYLTGHNAQGYKTWDYSRGIVRCADDQTVVADIKRNLPSFWHKWVRHQDGNEYLLCGEDYQGYTVVNLEEGAVKSYFPHEGYEGRGFCWAAVYPSPDCQVLAVDGCYWGGPYYLVLYDFSDPSKLPYREIARFEELEKVAGWEDKNTIVFACEVERRKSDKMPYRSLSEEEQNELHDNPDLVEYVIEQFRWTRSG
jgi:hypothetical protein